MAQPDRSVTNCLLEYDESVDAAYLQLSEGAVRRHIQLDDSRGLDYAANGSLVGIELLSPKRKGVVLDGLPFAADVARTLQSCGFRIVRSPTTG
ncbi:MAG: DUF2283 domain-containing protein [Chloroflexota bacterium]